MADLSHLVCWNSHRGFLKYASYTGCVGPSRFGESQADRHIKGCGPKRNYIERSVGALHVFGVQIEPVALTEEITKSWKDDRVLSLYFKSFASRYPKYVGRSTVVGNIPHCQKGHDQQHMLFCSQHELLLVSLSSKTVNPMSLEV
jgi:hypothetical protein